MTSLYEKIQELCVLKGINSSKLCTEIGVSKSLMTELKTGRSKQLSLKNVEKIADYFKVPIDFLLERPPIEKIPFTVIDEEALKFALFGDPEISNDLLEDVKMYARIKLEMDARKNR